MRRDDALPGRASMNAPAPHLRRAFAFRVLYLALAWSACLAVVLLAPADSAFALLVTVLAWLLPVAAPALLWFDWRWLKAHPDAVTRWGLRRR